MDICMGSVEADEHIIAFYTELKQLWGKVGMSPHKWMSNSEQVFSAIKPEEWKSTTREATKTLALLWDPKKDVFKIEKGEVTSTKFTKRTTLQKIASIYDPLGFIASLTVRRKVFIQEMWFREIEWDEETP